MVTSRASKKAEKAKSSKQNTYPLSLRSRVAMFLESPIIVNFS